MKKLIKFLKNKKGISMPELMAGISVMAILAGTGVTSAVNQINQAKIVATMDEMQSIASAMADYHADHPGDTISTITTLITKGYLAEGFTDAPDSDLKTDWKEDAWNNDYHLESPYIDQDGDFEPGYLESAGSDSSLIDDPATEWDEEDDNIKLTIEPMIQGN